LHRSTSQKRISLYGFELIINDPKEKHIGSGPDLKPPALSGQLLARNTVFNLVGQALPMLVAVITIPLIIKGLGVGRFGVLTLAWMVVGYFSLFDLGLGRATTKFVAEYLGKGENLKLTKLVWASILMLFGVGLVGMTVAVILMPWIVNGFLNIPPELKAESLRAFYLLACSIPIVTTTAGVRGVLEAMQRFDLINYVKVPTYIAAFAAPLAVLPFSTNLFPIVMALLASRLVGLIAYALFCLRSMPGLWRIRLPSFRAVKKLLSYGGWLTISNIIWPVMTYLDRFIVGAMLTMTAVAYYATPYELVAKLMIITGSLIGVIFPAFSVFADGQHDKLMRLHDKAVKYLLLALVPIVFVMIAMAEPFFRLWLGPEFARNSAIILQILAVAKLINSVSQVPSSAIQAMGRPDITAKLHMIELPIYLVMVWFLIKTFGITGAAMAWLLRTVLDTTLYFRLFYRLSPLKPEERKKPETKLIIWAAVMLLAAFLFAAMPGLALRIGLTAGILVITIFYCRHNFLDPEEKEYLRDIWRKFARRGRRTPQLSGQIIAEKKHE
jgi:O-antigen/teichoic acid export membrane protein